MENNNCCDRCSGNEIFNNRRSSYAKKIREALLLRDDDDKVPDEADIALADEIAFHFMDWEDNLHALSRLYNSPEQFSSDQCLEIICDFLTHVPYHLNCAAKLFND